MEIETIISFVSLFILFFIGQIDIDKKIKLTIFSVGFFESLVLVLYFEHDNLVFSSLICFCCIFYLNQIRRSYDFSSDTIGFKSNLFFYKEYFTVIGSTIVLLVYLVEKLFFDGTFNMHGTLLLLVGFSFLIFDFINYYDRNIANFSLYFILYISLFLSLLPVSFKLVLGEEVDAQLTNKSIEFLLVKPLSLVLGITNFNSDYQGTMLFFEDTSSQRFQGVNILRECSGFYSIVIFLSAFFSYLHLVEGMYTKEKIVFIIAGITISYFANLLRMYIIILAGHYYGLEALSLVHNNAGWLIFTIWVFAFWTLFSKYEAFIINRNSL